MRLAREQSAAPGPPKPGGQPADAIGAWLGFLTSMLPEAQRPDVWAELESHLRERVRDLMLAGESEDAATRRAIQELGDAARLARRLKLADRPSRRRLMNMVTLGVAGAALAAGITAISIAGASGRPARAVQYQADLSEPALVPRDQAMELAVPGDRWTAQRATLEGDVRIEYQPDPTLGPFSFAEAPASDVFNAIAEAAGLTPVVKWRSLKTLEVLPDSRVTLGTAKVDIAGAFAAINEAMGTTVGPIGAIDYRVRDGVLEISSRDEFDQRETTMVTYDISDINVESEALSMAIFEFIEPEGWISNGGSKASLTVLGSKLLVKAPPRVCRQIEWLLDQLAGGGGGSAKP